MPFSRKFIFCTISTVLTLLTVYWFRKKKIKQPIGTLTNKNSTSIVVENDGYFSNESKSNSISNLSDQSHFVSSDHLDTAKNIINILPFSDGNSSVFSSSDKKHIAAIVSDLNFQEPSSLSCNGQTVINSDLEMHKKQCDNTIININIPQHNVISYCSSNSIKSHEIPSILDQNGCSDMSSLDEASSQDIELEVLGTVDSESDNQSVILHKNSFNYVSSNCTSKHLLLATTIDSCETYICDDTRSKQRNVGKLEDNLAIVDAGIDFTNEFTSSKINSETEFPEYRPENSYKISHFQSNLEKSSLHSVFSEALVTDTLECEKSNIANLKESCINTNFSLSPTDSRSNSLQHLDFQEFSFLPTDLVNERKLSIKTSCGSIKDICDTSTSNLDIINPLCSSYDDSKKKLLLKNDKFSKCNSGSEKEDPQIFEMNINQHLSSYAKTIPSNNSTDNIYKENLKRAKTEIPNMTGLKVPENLVHVYTYEFELPQELCGRLIGKQGKHVKSIKDRSNANVFIKVHPFDPQLKVVVIEGDQLDVKEALDIIRRKYPLSRYPSVTLAQTNVTSSTTVSIPESLPLHLPEGVSCDVVMSSLVSAGHFFLQQPTHPTYPSLGTLDQCMMNCYSQSNTPLLPHPVEAGIICAAPVLQGWYRAQVIGVMENGNDCALKFVDYGGFSQIAASSLRQIRSDFMSLPFQASECFLANVQPIGGNENWSAEATATFEELAQGQILQAMLVDYTEEGIPCVHLYRVQGISTMFINKELIERGLAVWVSNGHWQPH